MHFPVPQKSKGFTILELLIVIGIVAILSTMAIISYQKMQHRARSVKCVANLRGLGASLNLYLAEHDRRFPVLHSARASMEEQVPTLDQVLLPFVDSQDSFQCPGDDQKIWLTSGTSYFWNNLLNGQHLGSLDMLGLIKDGGSIPVISDKENFHHSIGDEVNILYADGHLDKELRFVVTPD